MSETNLQTARAKTITFKTTGWGHGLLSVLHERKIH